MKIVKLIAGLLGLLGSFISIYVMFMTPATVSAMYPLFAAIFLIAGSISLIISTKKSVLGFATGSFLIALIMFFFHIMNVSSDEMNSGVSVLPDYIPDSIEMIGTAILLVAFIMAAVALFGKYEEKQNPALN